MLEQFVLIWATSATMSQMAQKRSSAKDRLTVTSNVERHSIKWTNWFSC